MLVEGDDGYVAPAENNIPEIDLAAFGKAEGSYEKPAEDVVLKEGDEGYVAPAPKADTTKAPEPTPAANTTAAPAADEFIRSIVGDDYELPTVEEGQARDDRAILADYYREQTLRGLHPAVRQMQEASLKEGFDPATHFNNVASLANIDSMSANDKIERGLIDQYGLKSEENPDGFTPEDIQGYLEKLNPIEKRKEADAFAITLKEKAQSALAPIPEMTQEQMEANIQSVINESKVEMNTLFALTEKYTDISGIKTSPEDIKSFNKVFETMVTPDAKTGVAPVFDLLSNNEVLYKMLFQLHKNPSGDYLKELLTDKSTQTKEEILNALNLNPKVISGGSAASNEIDVTAMSQPQRRS